MRGPTVAVSMLRALLDYLGERGLDSETLAAAIGLTRDELAHPQRLVDAARYERLMQDGIARLHDPLLGLEFGMAIQPQRWGPLGALLTRCATLREALAYQARFAHLVNAIGHGQFISHCDHVAIEWRSRETAMPALVEEAFAAWTGFARWATGRDETPLRVEFNHRAQGDPAVYTAFFGCPVQFQAGASRLCFDAILLDTPLRTPDAALAAALGDRVAAHERALDAHSSAAELRDWLRNALGPTVPDLHEAAAALGLPERTLQHRLQAEHTSFRRTLDTVRRERALEDLHDARLSIGDIATRLGFSEQSAFQRAFRRWTGTTPLAWRRRPRAADDGSGRPRQNRSDTKRL